MSEVKTFQAQGALFLDPGNVGSHVLWNVQVKESFRKDGTLSNVTIDGTVNLGDCDRTIKWGIHDYSYPGSDEDDQGDILGKFDNAIAELTKARRAIAQAVKIYDKRSKLITKDA